MPNELGISNLKRGLNFIASTVKATFEIDANNDGKVDGAEKIAYATKLIPSLLTVMPAFPDMRAEARRGELVEEEISELIIHIENLDFLPPDKDKIEAFVKKFVNWVNYNRRFIAYSIDFFRPDTTETELPETANI